MGLTISDAAEALGVTRNTLSELVNGKSGISPEMAVRLSTDAVRSCPRSPRPAEAVNQITVRDATRFSLTSRQVVAYAPRGAIDGLGQPAAS
jgi:transcriptional regulator with XRE-family HTH domain